ncbi:MAG: hypothetical protein ACR2OZ_02185 [Verrucomicrobiales bacterium]
MSKEPHIFSGGFWRTSVALLGKFILFAVLGAARSTAADWHVVHLPIKSYRLLAMSVDQDGFIWCGSIHRLVHRYDPRSGEIENIALPYDANVSACVCVGKKVYMLGQSYPRLIIFDQAARKFSEVKYPSETVDAWYGTEAVDGRHFYVFDRAAGLVKWDTQADVGRIIPFPYKGPLPGGGRHVAADNALWCSIHDFSGGKYIPLGIARFDLGKDEFSGHYVFPNRDAALPPFHDAPATLFFPYTLEGKLVPFDFQEKRWCRPLAVPQYGERFGFIGLPTIHQRRWYFSISTYNGTDLGCDGKPYHFCNALLEFDPRSQQFDFITLEANDAYYQISYTLSAGGELYATGSNIREPDGTLNQARRGDVIFWQTKKPERK